MSLINSATNTGVPVDSTLARYIKDAGMETKNNNNKKNIKKIIILYMVIKT